MAPFFKAPPFCGNNNSDGSKHESVRGLNPEMLKETDRDRAMARHWVVGESVQTAD